MNLQHPFHSRWGDEELDEKGWLRVPGFIMEHYHAFQNTKGETVGLGTRGFEFMSQVMSFKWDVPGSEARPSLETIADRMGMTVRGVQRIVKQLRDSGAMLVISQSGKPNVYEFRPLVEQCRKRKNQTHEQSFTPEQMVVGTNEQSFTPPTNNRSPEESEVRPITKKEKEAAAKPPVVSSDAPKQSRPIFSVTTPKGKELKETVWHYQQRCNDLFYVWIDTCAEFGKKDSADYHQQWRESMSDLKAVAADGIEPERLRQFLRDRYAQKFYMDQPSPLSWKVIRKSIHGFTAKVTKPQKKIKDTLTLADIGIDFDPQEYARQGIRQVTPPTPTQDKAS